MINGCKAAEPTARKALDAFRTMFQCFPSRRKACFCKAFGLRREVIITYVLKRRKIFAGKVEIAAEQL